MKATRPPGFQNVDLEIGSSDPLNTLSEEMGRTVLVLYSGPGKGKRHLLCLESARCWNTPDAAARALCSAVERLSIHGRRLWDRATLRHFDVGYELSSGARSVHASLRPDTLERVVALGATVAFSCYRADNRE